MRSSAATPCDLPRGVMDDPYLSEAKCWRCPARPGAPTSGIAVILERTKKACGDAGYSQIERPSDIWDGHILAAMRREP